MPSLHEFFAVLKKVAHALSHLRIPPDRGIAVDHALDHCSFHELRLLFAFDIGGLDYSRRWRA